MLDMTDFYKELVDEIADLKEEIERLRAVAIEKRAEADAAHGYSVEMRHEVERLRGVLREIACKDTDCMCVGFGGPTKYCIHGKARAALGEDK